MTRRKSLTDATVRTLQPTSKRQEIADGGCPNLWLVIHPTGRRVWVWRGSVAAVSERIQLGQYPSVDLKAARERARQVTEARDGGTEGVALKARFALRSPAAIDNGEPKERDDLDHLFDAYMRAEGGRNRTASLRRQTYDREVRHLLGSRSITSITRQEVRALLAVKAQTHPVAANRLLSFMRRIFNWMVEHDLLNANPCTGIRRPGGTEQKRQRALKSEEIRWLWRALDRESEPWRSGVRMLLLTGQRRAEVFGMHGRELDLQGDIPHWLLPARRAKNACDHVVPLTPAAVAILRSQVSDERPALVFPARPWRRAPGEDQARRYTSETSHASGYSRLQERLRKSVQRIADMERPGHEVPHWTLHDLRRTVVSGLNKLKVEFRVVEAVVNHTSGAGQAGVAGVYDVYDRIDEKRAALTLWAEHIEQIIADVGSVPKAPELANDNPSVGGGDIEIRAA